MFCEKCGAQVNPGTGFCGQCGARVPQQAPVQQPNYQQPNYQQPNYQQPNYQQPNYQQPNYSQPTTTLTTPEMPMKWYKFLIYFALIAGAILNFANGILTLTGMHYVSSAGSYNAYNGMSSDEIIDFIYGLFPDMEMADKLYGVILMITAVLGIVTRMALAKYKASGPKLLIALYATVAVGGLLYMLLVYNAIGDFVGDSGADMTSSAMSSIFVNIAMMAVNAVYFKKRQHLFVN